jgi:hypothetical protein
MGRDHVAVNSDVLTRPLRRVVHVLISRSLEVRNRRRRDRSKPNWRGFERTMKG